LDASLEIADYWRASDANRRVAVADSVGHLCVRTLIDLSL
jgi:hypothetical protein